MYRLISTIAVAIVMMTCAQTSTAQPSTIFRGPPRGALADRPADGSGLGQYTVTNCADSTCSTTPGSVWVTFMWNGSAWTLDSGGGGGATNLGTTVAADQLTVTNDTGTPAVLPQATPTTAGVISGADQAKLNAVEAAATADQTGAEILSAWETETGRSVAADGAKLDGIGLQSDSDGDGLYEVAYLWDADGDGSGKVVCTAKDVPDVACKASGEVIYRDFADDVNCAVHGGCAGGGQMEQTGLLLLENGVTYLNWPCWDASEPPGFNDPTAINDDLHDSTADTAYNHCPLGPSGTRRLVTVALLGWQGTIQGAGTDTRNPETTVGYKRDTGTYIADDRGPNWDNLGTNVWFGVDGFIRGINFGFQNGLLVASTFPTMTGEFAADGDSKGWGTIDGNQPILGFNGDICVSNTSVAGSVSADNWATSLVAGDIVIIPTSSMSADEPNVEHAYRVRDTPSVTECNGVGTVNIPLGGRAFGGTAGDFANNPIFSTQAYDGRFVIAARSDYFQSSATIEKVTIESQDWWNESGGDCSATGVWTKTDDNAELDFDCDTNPFVGFWGHTRGGLKNVVMRFWHDRGIDGESGSGLRKIYDTMFMFGQGGQVSDPSGDFRFREIEISDSQFNTSVFGTYGANFSIEEATITRSTFDYFASMQDSSVSQRFSGIRSLGNAFSSLFYVGCGARNNVFERLVITGHQDAQLLDRNGVVARFQCDGATTFDEIYGNVFDVVHMEGPGQGSGASAATNCAVVIDAGSLLGAENIGTIRDNTFSRFNYVDDGGNLNIDASLFCIQDDASATRAGDYSFEEILADQRFYGNSVRVTGGTGVARVYATCGLEATSRDRCEDALFGSAAGGADPIGCMNFENGAVPAVQSCQ